MSEVKHAGFYTILADECSDLSTVEQISLSVRYTFEEHGKHLVKEHFLAFIPTRDTTGETLALKISEKLSDLGLLDSIIVVPLIQWT